MQFGRIDGNAYTLDFQYPFTAVQAFAVALANVTQRLKWPPTFSYIIKIFHAYIQVCLISHHPNIFHFHEHSNCSYESNFFFFCNKSCFKSSSVETNFWPTLTMIFVSSCNILKVKRQKKMTDIKWFVFYDRFDCCLIINLMLLDCY